MSIVRVNWTNIREKIIYKQFVGTNTTVHNKRVSFECSDSNVRTKLYNIVNGPIGKFCSVAFI